MRRLTSVSNQPTADCWQPDAFDAEGCEPHAEDERLDILVSHAGVLRRPWIRVRVDPATGAVIHADVIAIR